MPSIPPACGSATACAGVLLLVACPLAALPGCTPGRPVRALAAPPAPAPQQSHQEQLTAPEPTPPAPATATGFGVPANTGFAGIVCFRGNAQRNYYGEGPAPRGHLRLRWRAVIGADRAAPQWNGVGWTGQPLVVEWPAPLRRHMNFLHPPGPATEVIVGGMDGQVHFYDAESGEPSRPALPLPVANPIKGTVSVDPRGYPLLYVGAALARPRTGYRVYSLTDFRELLFLPGAGVHAPRGWPAFDANGIVVEDRLLVAGENGLFYSVLLNTRWNDSTGRISLRPEVSRVAVSAAGIESSPALFNGHVYCTDSAGALWRIPAVPPLTATRLRMLGDDADTTATFDDDGTFYVGIQVDRRRGAAARGALFKVRAPKGDLVWRWTFPAQSFHGSAKIHDINGGVLATAAAWPEGGLVFVTTAHHPRLGRGSIVALDRNTGRVRWEHAARGYFWGSPWVVDGAVTAGDSTGRVYVLDAATGATLLQDATGQPAEAVHTGATIEASPVIWKGRIYVGLRGGGLACIGPAENSPPLAPAP